MAGQDDELVTVRRLADPTEAELLAELLEEEGIPASVPGNVQGTMLSGLSTSATLVPLRVPGEHAERAIELLDALDEYEAVDPADAPVPERGRSPAPAGDGDGPYRSGAPPEEPLPRNPRKPGVAVAAALLLAMSCGVFGAGHFYVRSTERGVILLALGWLCVLITATAWKVAGLGILLVILLDALGATKLIRDGHAA